MKLYSLANNLKANLKLKNNFKHKYFLLGATLFVLSSLFYYQNIFAQELRLQTIPLTTSQQNNISKKYLPHKLPQSTITPKVTLSKFNSINNIMQKAPSPMEQEIPIKNTIATILVGTPMENMIESISQQDKLIAAFLVGIALKESQFGKHSPKLNGQDCYNYWGYRGQRKRMGTGGHTCFNSPQDAVETVAKRLQTLAFKQHRNTPQKMIIWKCGSSCKTHSPQSVNKWIQDVSIYFNKIKNS